MEDGPVGTLSTVQASGGLLAAPGAGQPVRQVLAGLLLSRPRWRRLRRRRPRRRSSTRSSRSPTRPGPTPRSPRPRSPPSPLSPRASSRCATPAPSTPPRSTPRCARRTRTRAAAPRRRPRRRRPHRHAAVRAAARPPPAQAAGEVALDVPVERVGLVASVAACCAGVRGGARMIDAAPARSDDDDGRCAAGRAGRRARRALVLHARRSPSCRRTSSTWPAPTPTAHRELRGALERSDRSRVSAGGGAARVPRPRPVIDGPSAAALAEVAETDTLGAWRSVMEHTSDRELRRTALGVLNAGTLRCAQWRAVVGTRPSIPPFPGRR